MKPETRSRTIAITGAHMLLYSPEAEALRTALRDVVGWDHVDTGYGWLIFALPPAEIGVHPGENPRHEISFMCDNISDTVAELSAKGIEFRGAPEDQGFGIAPAMVLPGGVDVLLYEPRHATAV